jgi:hypothetical protein
LIRTYTGIPDWPRLRTRYQAYWRGDVTDGGLPVHIQNPRPPALRPAPEPWMTEASERKYLDPERLYALKAWHRTAWNWHADLFPYEIPTYGPNTFAGFCGGKVVFGENTVWHEPVISSVEEFPELRFDPGNRYWKALEESLDYAASELSGTLHVGLPDFGGPTDWISSFMGTENFLIACVESPDRVRDFALCLARECNWAFDLARARIAPVCDGSVNWMPVWHPGILGTVQDDMAVNFSPEMYDSLFLPALRCLAEHTQATVLHWHDACARHVDTLLREDAIDLIQFGHDPNTGPFREFLGTMRRIQAAGKKLFISCVEAGDVEFFIGNLDPRGLMMIIDTADDEASRQMSGKVREWTGRRLAALRDPPSSTG